MKPFASQNFSAAAASPLSDKLVRYGAGVGALAAVVALPAHSAQADQKSFDGGQFQGNPIYLDITNAGSFSNPAFAAAEFDLDTTSGYGGSTKPTVTGLNGAGVVLSTDGGTSSSADSFSTEYDSGTAQPQDYYLGLRIPANDGKSTDYFYGYVHFTFDGSFGTSIVSPTGPTGPVSNATGDGVLILDDYGYNSTVNAPSAVPEPSSVALLIAGAAGIGILAARRRKAAGVTGA